MRSYLRKKLGDAEAEDATALVFVRLAAAYDAGRDPNVGLVVNEVVYDTAREMSQRPITVEPARWAGEHVLHLVVPDTQDRYDFREAFDGALRALPGDEQEAFILTELRGLSSREAEGVLGTSYRTIHRRAENARLTVRKELR